MKKKWIIIALILLASLLLFGLRPNEPPAPNFSNTTGPAFVVNVVKPRIARPLFGILPTKLEEKLEGISERRFDHTSPGARAGNIAPNRLELSADGWALLIETDDQGKIAAGTYLVYTREISEKQRRLRCRPANQPTGYLRTTSGASSDVLDGSFLVEVATCENDETGRVIGWPPAPITVRGSFKGLPQSPR
ncbi:MAG: hypothetical protein JST85_26755 [Acidobacteria bacterium]|nr:hypothetical protein [Acidobacteriota bacterium]